MSRQSAAHIHRFVTFTSPDSMRGRICRSYRKTKSEDSKKRKFYGSGKHDYWLNGGTG